MQPPPPPESAGGPYVARGVGPSFAATAPEPEDVAELGVSPLPSGGAMPAPAGKALEPGRGAALVAGATALLMGGLLAGGSFAGPVPYAIVTLVVQLALVAAWGLVARPPGLVGALVIGALTALAADGVALAGGDRSIGPLVAVLAGAFGATTVAQLARGVARRNVTESFGATLTVAVAVIALASAVTLRRTDDAGLLVVIVLAATGGILLARSVDVVSARPAAAAEVPRGVVGLVVGSLSGAGVGALCSLAGAEVSTGVATLVGLLVGTAAVLADLGVDYARAGRLAAGTVPTSGPLGAVLGPLVALAVAAPVGYLIGLAS